LLVNPAMHRSLAIRVPASCLRAALIASFAILISPVLLCASEYGISTYRPGLMDLYVGMLPPPGHGVAKSLFMFQDASARVITEDPRESFAGNGGRFGNRLAPAVAGQASN
jgi:hypothetical protein